MGHINIHKNTVDKISTADIRSKFIEFFKRKNHHILESSPLIPVNDDSIFFINSGMAPLKEYFYYTKTAPYKRCASVQKCLRAGGKHNDLDNVGVTLSHHTLFEMLGNFSFGSYGIDKAVQLAYEFLIIELGFKKDRLKISTLPGDELTIQTWKNVCGIREDQFFTDKNNIWSMGEIGPTGSCTEIFLCNDDGSMIELWNIVMIKEEILPSGERRKLQKPCIDTGAGLERLAAALQHQNSNYENDLFQSIKKTASSSLQSTNTILLNVVADHLRALLALSVEGLRTQNQGRGYVLRQILRRMFTFCYTHQIKVNIPEALISIFPCIFTHHPEWKVGLEHAKQTLREEYKRFNYMIDSNKGRIDDLCKREDNIISGKEAFVLHDTYGLPSDILTLLIKPYGKTIDHESLANLYLNRNKVSRLGSDHKKTHSHNNANFVNFYNYVDFDGDAFIREADDNYLICSDTVFFPQSGGQNGDIGYIIGNNGESIFRVEDTIYSQDRIKHLGTTIKGSFSPTQKVNLRIDVEHRKSSTRHHSSTHLTWSAIKLSVDKEAQVVGSQVSHDRFRIDIDSSHRFNTQSLHKIEDTLNKLIREGIYSSVEYCSPSEAIKLKIKFPIGQKRIRVLRFFTQNSELISEESCCGTHVKNGFELGFISLIQANKISHNTTRIIGVSGIPALKQSQCHRSIVHDLSKDLGGIKSEDIVAHVKTLKHDLTTLQKNQREVLKNNISDKLQALHRDKKSNWIILEDINAYEPKIIGEAMRSFYSRHKDTNIICFHHAYKSVLIAGQTDAISALLKVITHHGITTSSGTSNYMFLRVEDTDKLNLIKKVLLAL